MNFELFFSVRRLNHILFYLYIFFSGNNFYYLDNVSFDLLAFFWPLYRFIGLPFNSAIRNILIIFWYVFFFVDFPYVKFSIL